MKRFAKLLIISLVLGAGFVVFGGFNKKVAAYPPPDIQATLQSGCPSLTPGWSYATGFIYPNPSTVASSAGGVNLYAAAHICPGSAVWGVNDVVLRMNSITRTSGSGNLNISMPLNFSPVSTDGTTYSYPSAPIWVTFDNLSPGYNCWSYSMTMTIGGPGAWGPSTTGGNSLCIQYTPPPAGTIYTTKYYPNSHAANGQVLGQPADVNNTPVCLTNGFGNTFACSSANSWIAGGILVSDNFYRVSVNVPANYKLTRVVVKGTTRIVSCSGPGNTGVCDVLVYVDANIYNFVDFFFDDLNRPPTGGINGAGCRLSNWDANGTDMAIVGWAQDPDRYPTDVILYVDLDTGPGISLQRVGRYPANYHPKFAPPGQTAPTWHDWFRIPQSAIAPYNDINGHDFYVNVVDKDKNGNDVGQVALPGSPVRIGPCVQPSCGSISTLPSSVEPGQPFEVRISAALSGPVPRRNVGFSINITGPAGWTGPVGSGTIPANSTTSGALSKAMPARPLGVYLPAYSITYDNGAVINCSDDVTVAARPFFVATNGDISSGFSTGSATCTSGWLANNGRLVSWYDTTTNHGAGTMLATIALRQIDGVRSAQQPSNPPVNQLSFANGNGTGTYGGMYGGSISCPKNYYGQSTNGTVVLPANSTTTVPPVDTRTSGNVTFTGGTLTGGSGTRSALFVNGNVYITNNVVLNNGGVTTPSQLANFYLVVQGNIYIDANVSRLDGVYIAQGNNTRGRIYTCASGFQAPTAAMLNGSGPGGSPAQCRTALTVNGAFIADRVNLYRSIGTVYDNIPAEIFNYTPITWLAPPKSIAPLFTGSTGSPGTGGYDAITTLQPVL